LETIMPPAIHPPINLPLEREVQVALAGQRALAAYLATQFDTQRIQIFDERNEAHSVELPTSALRLLVDILEALAAGNAVKVVPVHAELTTQEAADLLNVSRPHLIKLLESGDLSYHKTGKHRRVRFADLMDYKNRRDTASEQAMTLLAEQAQALRTGYE
jgi:excisionase family DNA binding protein